MNQELIQLFAPEVILSHFEYKEMEEISGVYRLCLDEKNDVSHHPAALKGKSDVILNGFMNPIELQTFPAKGKEVFLILRRRRWKLQGSEESYHNTYDFHELGMKATREFGAFLKEIDHLKND